MQKQIQLIPANKNNRYQIKENEKGFYHLLVVEEMQTIGGARTLQTERVIIFTPKDFKQYLAHKSLFTWKQEEIIHDPTLAPSVALQPEAIAEQPAEVEPAVKPSAPVKKQPYFASEAFKAKQKEKQQLKQSKQ
jgi:hypothetical protein